MIHVVAGVVYDAHGRVLIAQRLPGKHLAGGWEFPGGKLEPDEPPRDGLQRELQEELGITVSHPRPLLRLTHAYPYGDVLLDVWVVRRYGGEPRGLDGQALRWCGQAELEAATLLPADAPVVAALRLPEVLMQPRGPGYEIAGRPGSNPYRAAADRDRSAILMGAGGATVAAVLAAATAGASFLVLTEEMADDPVRRLCAAINVPVYVRGESLEQAWALGASGLHCLAG